ncbi:MAG: hypothetical protein ACJ8CB_33705, partial [Ktedonobacteraceae bacterium]
MLPDQERLLAVEEPTPRSTASLTHSSRAGEGGPHLDKRPSALGEQTESVVIWTPRAFLTAARPWEEGGKRRIAPAKFEGEHCLHPQPRHPCLEGDKAVDCLALFCYTIGAGKPAS